MTCPTSEQLAAIALGHESPEAVSHVSACAECQSALADIRQVVQELASAHDELAARQSASRDRLLAELAREPTPARREFAWSRFTFGGVGLSAAIAAVLLLSAFLNSSNQLSAMERITKAVSDVSSFSCKMLFTSDREASNDKPPRTLHDYRYIYWRAPAADHPDQFGDMRGTSIHEWIDHLPEGDQQPRTTLDLVEIHPSGKPGILIDYVAKKCFHTMPLRAEDIKNSPPLLWLRAVQQKAGRIVEDRGRRTINGREARGYVMTFDDAEPFNNAGPIEVWVDSETDLPVEFHFEWKKQEGVFDESLAATDIQWNTAIDPKLFDVTPPAGFTDVSLPKDEATIEKLVDALRLYAELSGGHYPPVETRDEKEFYRFKFDAAKAHRAMLEAAGFTGPVQDPWKADPKYIEIENSLAGLKELERILQNHKFLIGYNGDTVGPKDKDKALMWWGYDTGDDRDLSLLMYGDLRTEIVPREKWLPHVSKEIAEATE
jgi:outer membrane lipoprotein-sorting protein